ncbi:winged helix DNA-binding domain-containing protein [Paenibacillus sp. LHD-38]|uniref:winged helix DNA-binding domain-containing protein n=1 Tax=Paenibacillus sp. LHD-38 TaxID=3072143 RepID=UPI00280D930E|nr:winged helix DNA-binding domain-containing protein [Paenibacillus sp. LHD-38]MDQ8738280.1 winged helix DNA-binding domain-containing protein [Paenibacillus sp. LHD-38]
MRIETSQHTGSASAAILSKRQLNRALLERQMLLQRSRVSVLEAIEQLVAIQAQAPNPPYFALWSRLEGFRHEQLSNLMNERRVVRIALMRSTIHMVSARDCLEMRPLLAEVSEKGLRSAFGKKLAELDLDAIIAAGRALVEERPRTFNELGKVLGEQWPDAEQAALSAIIRTHIPLVQVPPRGIWGSSGPAAHTSAEAWLSEPLAAAPSLDKLLLRYLAAFGPATIKDMQVWSGLSKLRDTVESLLPKLRTFSDENGNELFDLPNAPLPPADTIAPPRFLSEFDNMLLSYANRSRIMDEKHKPQIFTINGIIRSTFLVDGFVRGTWKIEQTSKSAALLIQPFESLSAADREALAQEGARLLTFAAHSASTQDIHFIESQSVNE